MDRTQASVHTVYMAAVKHFLRHWRKFKGYTLEQVADRIGTTHATLSRIETGKMPYNEPMLEALAEIYGTEPASLLMRDPTDPEGMWSIWDQLNPSERVQAVQVLKVIQGGRTGTEG